MALTIDELNIQIASDSKNATRALTSLIKKLEKLKDTLNGSVASNITISNSFNKTTDSINKATNATNKNEQATKKANKSSKSWSDSLANQITKWRTLTGAFKTAANMMAGWFKESNDYIETLNLFNITMGDAAEEARKYAESVSEAMGIDPAEWMQNQGVFKNLVSGFGVAEEASNTMSQNLTQLSYDMASFFNTDVETAFDKLSSAMSGQVKGLREFGIDTTVASLQEYALAKGIDKSVRSMTQAEKSMLRYNYIMEKSVLMQGDMARTLVTPANALRILSAQFTQLKRAAGNVVSVLVTQLIPYVQATVEIITDAANALAKFFGFELPTIDYSGLDTGGYVDDLEDGEDAINGTADTLKKIKKQLQGFDELNIISNPDTDSGSSGGDVGGGALDMGVEGYDFLKNIDTSKIDEAKEKLKDILWYVGEIALGFLAWKLSKTFLGSLGSLAASLGLVLIVDSIKDVITDGLSWESVIKGAIGGALVGAAIGFKLGGPGGALLGATIGIGVTLMIQGITSWITEGANVGNIVTTLSGALAAGAGIYATIKWFNKSTPAPTPEMETATQSMDDISTGTSKLTTKLKKLATNLGWGVLILVEVAAAALIFTGTIALLGWELEQVGLAWEPVLENGETILKALGLGTALLGTIGLICGTMGGLGGGVLAAQMGIGIAILAEMGVATGLFIAEIWAIGWGLEQVGIAWQPVLDNGETIETAILTGTGLLIAIGVVTAALGAATVASAGLLPLAIGLGTALLVELSIATQALIDSLVDVAYKLSDDLAPALEGLNNDLPGLSSNMSSFTSFMTDFAGEVVKYTLVSSIAGIAATIDKIIDFFTTDPVQRMSDEVWEQNEQFDSLIENLEECLPDIEYAIDLVKKYNKSMEEFSQVSGKEKPAIITFLSDIVNGIWEGIKKTINWIIEGIEKMANGIVSGFNWVIRALNNFSIDVPDWVTKLTGLTKFGFNIREISSVSIPRLASGGIVNEGQMFIAREAGPELVGSIGNKTAVANNDQIISGIEGGVYRAMMAANANNSGGNQTIRIINEIDGDVVGEKVIQYHNGKVIQTGVSPLLV